ncbi:hypothetical protein HC723_10945 [Vibrio sp. S11_S32]|uniref:hypothetical protein n=1 Tax=Vibrio sp. S11_S32 TaxID=2720225 RepID=UPI001681727F|nr:hypothetical protein [Vibrio sp. S11_S32]MBD1576945.1 hypothetical protein [Vibrio sp. S11_S32]
MKNKRNNRLISLSTLMNHIKNASLAIGLMSVPILSFADGTDPFAGTKTEITAAMGSSSELHFAMLAIGLAVAAVTGAVTKNWVSAIGTFIVLIIFMNVAGTFIGLT